jgi:hypothetical protein
MPEHLSAGPCGYLRPAQAAKAWPHDGKPPHPSKVVRAILRPKASRRRPGEVIRLQALRDSQGWLTTAEWIEQYLAALTADRLGTPIRSASVEARAQQARARLAASGW